jgi:4-hydroxyphenylacetate 3-monooxygenase
MNFDLPGGAWHESNGTPYLCGFVVSVDAPGLRWICRDKLAGGHAESGSPFAKLDEMDCVALFDDCLIPWERVYMFAPLTPDIPGMEFAMAGLQHPVLIRCIAKARFLIGLAHLVAESSRVNQFINVQERLGEMIWWLRTLEALAVAVVEDAYQEPATGVYYPNPQTAEVAGIWCTEIFPKMVSHLRDLGGSRLVAAPQESTLELLGDAAERHFRGNHATATENVAIFRLAWEITGSTWGARQDLYERFHFGDATLRRVGGYVNFDISQAVAMVRRILVAPGDEEQIFPQAAARRALVSHG